MYDVLNISPLRCNSENFTPVISFQKRHDFLYEWFSTIQQAS